MLILVLLSLVCAAAALWRPVLGAVVTGVLTYPIFIASAAAFGKWAILSPIVIVAFVFWRLMVDRKKIPS
jgi:hypothetical protein